MDQHPANDWANDSSADRTAVDSAAQTPAKPGRRASRSVILGVAAACLLSGGIGYGIGSVSHGDNYPNGGFAEFDGRHGGPGGQQPGNGQQPGKGQLPNGPQGQQPNGQLPGDGDGDGFGRHGFDPDGDHQPPNGQQAPQSDQPLGSGSQSNS